MEQIYFKTPADFRKWLEQNHLKKTELLVAYYKKATKLPSITWPESVDQALCFGWIDGIRHSIDDKSYSVRFTPRKRNSTWSAVNIRKYKELTDAGLMTAAGEASYKRRKEDKSQIYAYEQGLLNFPKDFENQLKANKKAWAFFETLPPSAKKPTIWWILSAKREDTRERRMKTLIQCCLDGLRIPSIRRKKK